MPKRYGLTMHDKRTIEKRRSVVLLGNGPSLDLFDPADCPYDTIGINRSWRKVVSPLHVMLASPAYWNEILQGRWQPRTLVTWSNRERWDFWSERLGWKIPQGIKTTGEKAIEVALALDYEELFLIGYDCNEQEGHFKTGDTEGFFADANDKVLNRQSLRREFARVAAAVGERMPHVRVYNCSPRTTLRCWPYAELPSRSRTPGPGRPESDRDRRRRIGR